MFVRVQLVRTPTELGNWISAKPLIFRGVFEPLPAEVGNSTLAMRKTSDLVHYGGRLPELARNL